MSKKISSIKEVYLSGSQANCRLCRSKDSRAKVKYAKFHYAHLDCWVTAKGKQAWSTLASDQKHGIPIEEYERAGMLTEHKFYLSNLKK
jgi:hypothetical protein